MPFVELRAHSAFSFGDGTASPEALVARAADLGYSALALTDTADVGGIIRFTLEAERVGMTGAGACRTSCRNAETRASMSGNPSFRSRCDRVR
jgi:DNA polymerase III alpha subunit